MKTIRILCLLTLIFPALFAQAPAPTPPPKMFAVRLSKGPAWDETKSPNEQAGMREHSANIARLRREGVVVLGARFGELGLLVLRVPDEAAVQAQLAPDPAIAGGVFKVQTDVFMPFAHGNTAWLTTPEAVVLRAYLDAGNRLDADAVAALCAENFVWYNVEGNKLTPEVQGREKLHGWLLGYYKNVPSARSEFLSIEQAGPFLTVRERASWENKQGKRLSQQAIGTYEIR
ncbi:MAG: Nuclear transport factor 2 family protein, partial [Verrucomicrobiota bacterium]|nr:Nuclear transport factor 2 family protein [Verrucomicrobiota bacterium]